MFKRLALIFLAASAIALVSCSSSGDDEKKAVNPLSEDEQLAATTVQEINDVIMNEISGALSGVAGPTSVRAVDTEDFSGVLNDENGSGTVSYAGSVSYDAVSGRVTFTGTYTFTNYEFSGIDPEDEGNLINYVVNGTETVEFSSTTTESETTGSSVTVLSEDDTGDLSVTIDGALVELVFDYHIGYTYTSSIMPSGDTYVMSYSLNGSVEGTFNDQYVYYPISQSGEIDFSDIGGEYE